MEHPELVLARVTPQLEHARSAAMVHPQVKRRAFQLLTAGHHPAAEIAWELGKEPEKAPRVFSRSPFLD